LAQDIVKWSFADRTVAPVPSRVTLDAAPVFGRVIADAPVAPAKDGLTRLLGGVGAGVGVGTGVGITCPCPGSNTLWLPSEVRWAPMRRSLGIGNDP